LRGQWLGKQTAGTRWQFIGGMEKTETVATKLAAKVGKKTEQLFDRFLPIPVNL
jgi:hypothetical protein